MSTKILTLIPARRGSVGVPNKHLKQLGNKPLIQYTIETALKAKTPHTCVLSSDCPEIIQFASKFPKIHVPFIRPDHLATAETPTLPVIRHVLDFYLEQGIEFDYVCLLQPTTPFRREGIIDDTIARLLKSNADSLVTVRHVPSKYNPNWCLNMMDDNRLEPALPQKTLIPRRQDLPETYHRDGQIYLASSDLVRRGFLMTSDTIGFLNESGPDINIDTPADWKSAQRFLADGSL